MSTRNRLKQEPSRVEVFLEDNRNVLGILAIIGLVVYLAVLWGGFVFDDNVLVENNLLIRSLSNFWQFFTSSSQTGAGVAGSNFYRPLQYVVYALINGIFGIHSWAFHLVSVSVHIANAYLVFQLLLRLSRSRIGSFLGALLFLVHPVNAEAVSYISGIADPLGLLFLLIGLITFNDSAVYTWKRAVYVLIWSVLALLSKESMVIFPLLASVLVLYQWELYDKDERRWRVSVVGGMIGMSLMYLVLRATTLNFTGTIGLTGEENEYTTNVLVRIATFICNIWEYVKMTVAPFVLYLERPYVAYTSVLSLRGLFGIGSVAVGSVLAYRSFRERTILFVALGWIAIAFLPVSGIIPLNAMFLEHWMYVPLVGVAIGVAAFYDSLTKEQVRALFLSIFACFLVFFSIRTIVRNTQWADPVTFYLQELEYSPNSARVRNNLAMEYADEEKYDAAIAEYTRAIELYDVYPQTHNNLAMVYGALGRYGDAESEFFKALRIDNTFLYSYRGLLQLYEQTEQTEEAAVVRALLEKVSAGSQVTQEDVDAVLELSPEGTTNGEGESSE